MSHCHQGDYYGSCKYGEVGCPALAGWSPRTDMKAILAEAINSGGAICPVCEGETTVCDGGDDGGCSMPCPPCGGSGMNLDFMLDALEARGCLADPSEGGAL